MENIDMEGGGYDALLEELKKHSREIKETSEAPPVEKKQRAVETVNDDPLKEDELSEFILQKSQKLLNTSMAAISDLAMYLGQGATTKEIEAFSELIKSTNSILDTLNNINIENKKSKSAKEIKNMELESKKQLKAPSIGTVNNILVASREEVMSLIENNKKDIELKEKSIDVEFVESKQNEK